VVCRPRRDCRRVCITGQPAPCLWRRSVFLNDARWLVEHHEIPSVDHFSYTAQGQPWIYPVGGGLFFYGLWLIGGYASLSWSAALATAATTALLLRRGSVISVVLTALAVPLIAARIGVRADMFTTVLSAAYLALLWRYHRTGRARLWMLPLLMILWSTRLPAPRILRERSMDTGIPR
jgi:hypothetical protein